MTNRNRLFTSSSPGLLLLLSLLLLSSTTLALDYRKPLDFKVEDSKPATNLVDFKFVSRFMVPYGPDSTLNGFYAPKNLLMIM